MAGTDAGIGDTIPDGVKVLRRTYAVCGQRFNAEVPIFLAYFNHPRTSNGPKEAPLGRLEHPRGIALSTRNRGNYLTRSLLHAGGMDRLILLYL